MICVFFFYRQKKHLLKRSQEAQTCTYTGKAKNLSKGGVEEYKK